MRFSHTNDCTFVLRRSRCTSDRFVGIMLSMTRTPKLPGRRAVGMSKLLTQEPLTVLDRPNIQVALTTGGLPSSYLATDYFLSSISSLTGYIPRVDGQRLYSGSTSVELVPGNVRYSRSVGWQSARITFSTAQSKGLRNDQGILTIAADTTSFFSRLSSFYCS